MIRHLFKLIWNQKRRNLGLLFEMFFSFLVLFAVFSFIMHNYHRYTQSIGFDYDGIWTLTLHWPNENKEEIISTQRLLREQLKSYPQIEHFTFSSSNTPYSGSWSTTSLELNGKEIYPHIHKVDHSFEDVLNVSLAEGRWFHSGEKELEGAPIPIVINQKMRQDLFKDKKALGYVLEHHNNKKLKVIGVIDNFKARGEFTGLSPAMFFPEEDSFTYSRALIKVKPNVKANFEAQMLKELSDVSKGWTIENAYMKDMRKDTLSETLIPMAIFLIICGFLIFNVALGLFGVLWQNISKRREEIGIRRAMGATKNDIGSQFITEVVLITTLSVVLGIFFAIQFPLLGVFQVFPYVYIEGILFATLFIYMLVLICAYYPSRQAAQLQPAMTLHEE